MKLVQLSGTPQALAAFHSAVHAQLRGRARRKPFGCRAGQYVVHADATEAFEKLARDHGIEAFVYDAADLERPRDLRRGSETGKASFEP